MSLSFLIAYIHEYTKVLKSLSPAEHPEAGFGVVVEGTARPGTILAFYPGRVYFPEVCLERIDEPFLAVWHRSSLHLIIEKGGGSQWTIISSFNRTFAKRL